MKLKNINKIYVVLDPKNKKTALMVKEYFYHTIGQAFCGDERLCILRDPREMKDVFDSVVIFIMPPKRLPGPLNLFDKNNNIFAMWNFEPITQISGNRLSAHTDLIKSMCSGSEIDYVWHFSKEQLSVIKSEKISYLPMGFENCLCKDVKKTRDVLFLGSISKYRGAMFSKIKKPQFLFNYGVGEQYSNFNRMLENISTYRVGIDSAMDSYVPDYIRWHRIMLYAANKVVLVTDNKLLENYGFRRGQHYFYFSRNDAGSLVETINKIFDNKTLMLDVAHNMYEKVEKEFRMKSLIENKFKECGIKIDF